MPALEKTAGSGKVFYTAVVDAQIVAMVKEGKKVKDIAAAVGHSPASIQYRIGRVLTVKDLDQIKYDRVVVAAPVLEEAAE